MKISFVEYSTIISNYVISYYIIARYKVYSMIIKIEIVHTANVTAITSTMCNIARASTNIV